MRLIDADKLRDKCDEYDWNTIDNEPTVEAVSIKWLCDYVVIIAENNYEQDKFISRLIENFKSELNEDKDKVAIDNLMRLKENWKRDNETCGQ